MRVVFALFGGIIAGAFAVIVVVTVTRTYVKNRRGEPFVVEAFTEVVRGDTYLEVSKRTLSSAETRGTADLQPPPVVLGCLTVGPLPKESVKQSLSVVARCLAKALVKANLGDGAEAVKASCLRGRARTGASCAGSPQRTMFNLSKGQVE